MTVRTFWRQRPLVCLAAFFGVGLWLGKTAALPPWIYAAGIFGSVAVLMWALRNKRSALAAVFSAAFFLAGLYMNLLWNRPLPAEGNYTVCGVVSGDVEIDGTRLRACLRQAEASDGDGGVQALGRVYWTWDLSEEEAETAANLFDGDRVAFAGRVYRPSGRQNPHGLDFRLYLREKGILMGVTGADGLQVEKACAVDLSGWTYRLRRALCSRMDAVFGEDAAYPKALLLGERQYLSPETVTAFRDLGIAHILAVSGLHVGLLAGLLMGAANLLGVPLRARVAALCAFLLAYCALLDFSPPVVRASLLLTGAWVRRTVRRSEDGLTLLAAAFLIILLVHPFALFSLSFQLTFAAVLGLILLSEPAERLLSRLHLGRLARPFAATVSASAAVAVPVANAFHQLSLMGLLVNPLACFAAGLILPAYVAVFIAGCVYLPAGQALAAGLRFCVGWLPEAMDRAAALPFATVRVPSVSMWLAAALAVCLLLCTRYVVLAPRKRLALGGAVLAAGVLLWQGTLCRDVRYVQLAAGQADCAVLEDGRSTVVIDAGENGGDLMRYLAAEGRRVDTLVLTHLHSDHAGGVRQLLEAGWPVDRVVLPACAGEQAIDPGMTEMLDVLRNAGARIEEAVAGDEIVTPRCRIRFVWPYAPRKGQNANWYCLAALCEMDGVTLLTLSDLPGDYEMYAAAPADILKAAHHGSNSGTGQALLERVSPQAVVLTCGRGGQLPGQETLARLAAYPAELFRTDETGAVTVRVRQGAYQIECFLRHRAEGGQMDHNDFFAALNAGNIAACYLFEGEEEYTKRAALQALRERLTAGEFAAMNDATLQDPAPDALIAAAETLPFMADRRLVVVRDCAMLSGTKPKDYDEDKAIEQLTAYLDHLPDTACIVFYVAGKADARRKLYGVLKKKAALVSFKTLDDRQLSQWIVRELKRSGRGITGTDCERLWFTVGKDLNLLTGELEKLIAYTDGRDSVTAEDIQAVCTQSREYRVFDLASVLLSGQAKKALTMADDMLRGGEERLYLLTLLGGQCRKMYYAAAMKKTGAGESAIASALGIPFFAVRTALQQAAGYTVAQMRDMCALCVETEFRVKSGEAPEDGSLESVMLRILAMRQRKERY